MTHTHFNAINTIGLSLLAWAGLTIALALPVQASPIVTDFNDIEYWVGSGSNQAALVLDFFDGGNGVVWGYRWDTPPSQTAENMILAIDAVDPSLSIGVTYYDFGGGPTAAIDSFTYGGRSATPDWVNSPGLYFFIGTAYNNMVSTFEGVSDHALVNGEWLALALRDYNLGDYSIIPSPFPTFEPAQAPAVPEPSTLVLVAIGLASLLVMLWVRHRNKPVNA